LCGKNASNHPKQPIPAKVLGFKNLRIFDLASKTSKLSLSLSCREAETLDTDSLNPYKKNFSIWIFHIWSGV